MLSLTVKKAMLDRLTGMFNPGRSEQVRNGPFTRDARQVRGVGAQIIWLAEGTKAKVCGEFGVDPGSVEIMLMRVSGGPPEVHRHHRAESLLKVLGAEHGFPDPSGGTLMGTPDEEDCALLSLRTHEAGEFVQVKPGVVHGFVSDQPDGLVAIGIQDPPIRRGETFDIEEFKLLRGSGRMAVQIAV